MKNKEVRLRVSVMVEKDLDECDLEKAIKDALEREDFQVINCAWYARDCLYDS